MITNTKSRSGGADQIIRAYPGQDTYGILKAIRAAGRGRIIFNNILFEEYGNISDKVGSYALNTSLNGKESRYICSTKYTNKKREQI